MKDESRIHDALVKPKEMGFNVDADYYIPVIPEKDGFIEMGES